MRAFLIALMVFAGLSQAAQADSIDIGPAVGASIPQPFIVYDSAGAEKRFADLTGEKGAVLVFVRSAAWCPYCIQQLRDIEKVAAPLSERGYNLVSVSYDAPDVLAGFAKKFGITYALVSDRDSAMIDALNIRDPQYKEGSRAYGVPMPGIFVVDAKGVVQAKLAEEGYKVRPPSEAVIESVDGVVKP